MDRIRMKIDQDRREYAELRRRDEDLWSKVSNNPPAEAPGNWRVYLANRSNGPCIYEYTGYTTSFWRGKHHNKLVDKLMFPNESGRNYYKIGDKILHREIDERTLTKWHPELRNNEKIETGWSDLLWWFLNEGKNDTYKCCWIIREIIPDGKGGGTIELTCLIHFEGFNVELHSISRRKREQLNQNFVDSSKDFSLIESFSKATITISLAALQAVSKAAQASVKILAGKLMKRQLQKRASKRVRTMIFKAVRSHLIKTSISSVKEFIVVLAKELNRRDKEKDLFSRAMGENPPWSIFEPALREAFVAFIAKIIEELFSASVGEAISNISEMKKIEKELAEIYLKYLMTTPIQSFIKSINTAYEKAQRNNKPIGDYLDSELENNYADTLKQIFLKDIVKAISG